MNFGDVCIPAISPTSTRVAGVFEGGGIKGIALAGAAAAAMDSGYVFEATVGTSAGALVGSLLAAGYQSEEIRNAGLYDAIWQAFAVLLPVKTVGVMGDSRTYDNVCGLRAVTSTDGMTADVYPFDASFLTRVATRIVNEVKGINRVVYDYTSKPPGTIEWE